MGGFAMWGIVEGYYGPAWTPAERLTVLRFAAESGLNTYLYGPKDDPYHRMKWREPYPNPAQLTELAQAAVGLGIRFIYALHPYGINAADSAEVAALLAKVGSLQAAGIADFALFFDDIPEQTEAAGRTHGELARQVADAIGRPLLVCPTDYAGTAPSPYRDGLAQSIPADTLLLWTGSDVVVGEVTAEQAVGARAAIGRNLVLWDNFPVNDFAMDRLFLGPLVNRPASPASLHGILANPMIQALPSLIAIATVGEYAKYPAAYVPEVAWRRAIERVAELTGVPSDDLAVLALACGGWPPSAPRWPEFEAALETVKNGFDTALTGLLNHPARHSARSDAESPNPDSHRFIVACGGQMVAAGTTLAISPVWAPWARALAAAGDLTLRSCHLLELLRDGAPLNDDEVTVATSAVIASAVAYADLASDVLRPPVTAFARAILVQAGFGEATETEIAETTTPDQAQGFDWATRDRQENQVNIDLGGDWLIREALGETWRWYVDAPLPTAGNNVADAAATAARTPGWLPARLPSSVRGDLLRAEEVASPYVGRDSKLSEWVSERHWVYRRSVSLARPLGSDEVAFLELDAVDPSARVFVDGQEVGVATGPFGRNRFDVTDLLKDGGEHRIALVLAPAPESQPQVGRTGEVQVHAPRMTYGWDFCPRLVHQGVWGPLRIVVGTVVDGGTWATTGLRATADGALIGEVRVHGHLRTTPGGHLPVAVMIDGEMAAPATEVFVGPEGRAEIDLTAVVPQPRRWWPHGLGDQHRYEVTLLVGGAPVWRRQIGFREVVWEVNPGSPEGAEPYSLRVNGRPVKLTGWNWAPADALYGEISRERLRHLLTLARDSGGAIVRIWGGGLIETEDFYDLADELGLLIWQEFSQSSSGMQSAPAETPEFVALMREAARSAVKERGHHPSLVLWGGGNELDLDGVPLTTKGSAALTAIAEELARLDPERRWVATSPTGPKFHNRLDVIEAHPDGLHDVHGPWEHQGLVGHYTLYNAGTCLAHTEFGVEGMASARQYAALLPGDPRPLDRTNPLMRHLGEWWNNAPQVHALFGGRLVAADGREDVAAVRRASQLLQATGLGYAVEADLRRSPRCSMVLPWQLAESFPNAWCTAVVEYYGDAKPAYHAVRRAFTKRRATLQVERAVWQGCPELAATAWVWADQSDPAPTGGTLSLALVDLTGAILAQRDWPLSEVGNPTEVGTLRVPAESLTTGSRTGGDLMCAWVAQWRDAAGMLVDEEVMLASLTEDWGPLCDLPIGEAQAKVQTTSDQHHSERSDGEAESQNLETTETWHIEITNTGPIALVGLGVSDPRPAGAPGYLRLHLDPAPLLPGKTRIITARFDGVPLTARELRLDAWNLSPQTLHPTR
ncbi:MAG: beta-N-acetylglucosaminidase domain-containing protein [Promicromonosporaceae bacterium]|nr:beta-N-acetylglucosaminidase domain-containing protein [Promicromonosporaceae bacterium]